MSLNEEDKSYLTDLIDNEGFSYAMLYYSNHDNIQDDTFHELLTAYKNASDKLESYITSE